MAHSTHQPQISEELIAQMGVRDVVTVKPPLEWLAAAEALFLGEGGDQRSALGRPGGRGQIVMVQALRAPVNNVVMTRTSRRSC